MWALLAVHRNCRDLAVVGGLVVPEDERPEAFTTAQTAGRIIVTTGLLRTLAPQERRPLVVTAVVAGLLVGVLPAAAVQHTGEGLFEHAAQPNVVRHA